MSSEFISKLLFSAFTLIYAIVFVRSILLGEVFFIQGRGARLSENKKTFFRFVIYHGLIVLIFSAISVSMWLFL